MNRVVYLINWTLCKMTFQLLFLVTCSCMTVKVSWPPEELMREPIAFGDFLDVSIPTASRIYKHLPELKKIQAVLEECHASHGRKASQVQFTLATLTHPQ